MDRQAIELVTNQMVGVQAKYPGLELVCLSDGELRVQGPLAFRMQHDSKTVEDSYRVEIRIPKDFPRSVPAAFEPDGEVPEDFEHFMPDGELCLGAPVEVNRIFQAERTLLGFIDNLLVPYLFSSSFRRDYGELPFGERAHGVAGIEQFYQEEFEVGDVAALKLLKCLADSFAPPARECPCGSGRRLRECHAASLDQLRPFGSPAQFEGELLAILNRSFEAKRPLPYRDLIPERMLKLMRKNERRRRREKKRRRSG